MEVLQNLIVVLSIVILTVITVWCIYDLRLKIHEHSLPTDPGRHYAMSRCQVTVPEILFFAGFAPGILIVLLNPKLVDFSICFAFISVLLILLIIIRQDLSHEHVGNRVSAIQAYEFVLWLLLAIEIFMLFCSGILMFRTHEKNTTTK